jgi:hypothetical protein
MLASIEGDTMLLAGQSNYRLGDSCNELTGVGATVVLTERMIAVPIGDPPANEGMGFQLNCYSASGYSTGAQQYAWVVWWKTQSLHTWVCNFPAGSTTPFLNSLGESVIIPTDLPSEYSTIPTGYSLDITLITDGTKSVSGAVFTANDAKGATILTQTVALLDLQTVAGSPVTQALLAPIVGFEFVIVGYADKEYTVLSSGAGTITYESDNQLAPQIVALSAPRQPGPCGEALWTTAESSNVTYGQIDFTAVAPIVQSFSHRPVLIRLPFPPRLPR